MKLILRLRRASAAAIFLLRPRRRQRRNEKRSRRREWRRLLVDLDTSAHRWKCALRIGETPGGLSRLSSAAPRTRSLRTWTEWSRVARVAGRVVAGRFLRCRIVPGRANDEKLG